MKPLCKKCGAVLQGHRKGKTGLCQKCYLALGTSHGGKKVTPAICFNKKCLRPFACPEDRDPKWSYCPLCIDKRDNQYSTSPHMRAIY
ncbi:MAG: hypothetical protein WC455_29160 [Dehalococcoidia bacterium]|jgi:hypothetical protein